MSNKLKLIFVNRELCPFKLLFEMALPVYLNFFAYYKNMFALSENNPIGLFFAMQYHRKKVIFIFMTF